VRGPDLLETFSTRKTSESKKCLGNGKLALLTVLITGVFVFYVRLLVCNLYVRWGKLDNFGNKDKSLKIHNTY